MPVISFKVPVHVGKRGTRFTYETKTGQVVWLTVGDKRVRCVLQANNCLAHFATGGIIFSANTIAARQVSELMRFGHHARMSKRAACVELMAELVDRIGADAVHAKFAAHPTINV